LKKPPHIIYSLSGEGRGHASVALALHRELVSRMPELSIRFYCGGKASHFLQAAGLDVVEIPYLGFSFDNGAVRPIATLGRSLRLLTQNSAVMQDIRERVQEEAPSLVICDFEYFIPRIARSMNIPLVNLTHQGIITETRHDVPSGELLNCLSSRFVVGLVIRPAQLDIITSFFLPPPKPSKKNRLFIGPIIRPELTGTPEDPHGDTILVYAMDPSFDWILSALRDFPRERFVVSGIPPSPGGQCGNIHFREIDPNGFFRDLRRCKAVIATGGHTLMGEVLSLGKPLLALYQPNQFEQALNAHYLKKMGCGLACEARGDIRPWISRFLEDLGSFEKNIRRSILPGNSAAAEAILRML
jgi:uncharacterized protein (TIGR00661 family)